MLRKILLLLPTLTFLYSCSSDKSPKIESVAESKKEITLDPNDIVLKYDTIFIGNDSILEHQGDELNGYVISENYRRSKIYYKDGWISKRENFHWSKETLSSSLSFSKGKIDGPYKSWHPNGQLESEGLYLNGFQDSLWTYYYDNGNIDSRGYFKGDPESDRLLFTVTDLDPEFEDIITTQYAISGTTFHGKWQFFDYSGKLIKIMEFDHGKIKALEFVPQYQ